MMLVSTDDSVVFVGVMNAAGGGPHWLAANSQPPKRAA